MNKIESQIINHLILQSDGLAAEALRAMISPRVSQPTLWRYLEKLRVSGRVRKIGKSRATRYQIVKTGQSIADQRSRSLHIAVGHKLIRRPELITQARKRLERMHETIPYAKPYLEQWGSLLSSSLEDVLQVLGADSEEANALRHVSPFAGILTEKERLKALAEQGLIN